MRPSELCLVDFSCVRVSGFGITESGSAACCALPKMTDDDTYMLTIWASHIKDAARQGRTQYVLEELVNCELSRKHCMQHSPYVLCSRG